MRHASPLALVGARGASDSGGGPPAAREAGSAIPSAAGLPGPREAKQAHPEGQSNGGSPSAWRRVLM
jgi:hypothetical protein